MLIYTNTRSKTKNKLKPKAERLEYEAWCKKHGIPTEGKRRREKTVVVKNPVVVSGPYIRKTEKIPSLNSFINGPVNTGSTKNTYTGDKVLGIAAMHKSNLVPIFTNESAVEVSTMRRN